MSATSASTLPTKRSALALQPIVQKRAVRLLAADGGVHPRVGEPGPFVGLTRTLRAVHGGTFVPRFSRPKTGFWHHRKLRISLRCQKRGKKAGWTPRFRGRRVCRTHNAECGSYETINHVGARAAFVNEKCYHSKRRHAEKKRTVRAALRGVDRLGWSKQTAETAAGIAESKSRSHEQLYGVLHSRLQIRLRERLHKGLAQLDAQLAAQLAEELACEHYSGKTHPCPRTAQQSRAQIAQLVFRIAGGEETGLAAQPAVPSPLRSGLLAIPSRVSEPSARE